MASSSKFKNILALFGNAKTRTIIIFTSFILLLTIGIGLTGIHHSINSDIPASASTVNLPQIQSLPGAAPTTPYYQQAAQTQNIQQAQQAAQTGASAVATIVGNPTQLSQNNNSFIPQLSSSFPATAQPAKNSSKPATNNNQDNNSQQQLVNEQQTAQQILATANNQDYQQETKNLSAAMQTQAKALLTDWQSSNQEYVRGKQTEDNINSLGNANESGSSSGLNNSSSTSNMGALAAATQQLVGTAATSNNNIAGASASLTTNTNGNNNLQTNNSSSINSSFATATNSGQSTIIKAGDIQFAVLDTAVNTDEPGPIMATITEGPLKGAKLLGTIQTASSPYAQNVVLQFNTISLSSQPNSMQINAVGVDPYTSRTALASSVNNHYLQRYGMLLGAAFLEGYGEAVANSNSVYYSYPFGGGFSVLNSKNTEEQVAMAFGTVGQVLGQQMANQFNRPPTIKVSAGIGIGILFLSDINPSTAGNSSLPSLGY